MSKMAWKSYIRNLTHFPWSQSAFMTYMSFESYGKHILRHKTTSSSCCESKGPQDNFLEPVLAYWALKSVNLTLENERLVKVTIREQSATSRQLKKNYAPIIFQYFVFQHSSRHSEEHNRCCIRQKTQANSSEIFYCCPCFSGHQGGNNHGKRGYNKVTVYPGSFHSIFLNRSGVWVYNISNDTDFNDT